MKKVIEIQGIGNIADINVVNNAINNILSEKIQGPDIIDIYNKIFSCIDLTSLEGSDTRQKIETLCNKALNYQDKKVASICVYPVFVKSIKEYIANAPTPNPFSPGERNNGQTYFKVASVAGGFPSGQIPMHIKHLEVKYALEQGADEIDFVINQGKFLETDYNYVFDEVAGAKQLCKDKLLKVILETGELLTPENIYKASRIVIEAGADFIKTSTGKTSVSATQQAVFIMCCAISEYFNATGKTIGIKPAGGISMPNQAIEYYHIINHILGENWLKPSLMRFGASRLADKLYDAIKHSI